MQRTSISGASLILGAIATLANINLAEAAAITANGITFSEETGAFTITGLTGTGSAADPFVLSETVTDTDVTIKIEGLSAFQGSVDGVTGFYLQKIVTNNTGETWNFYDHELQEILGTPSDDGDGLSFAQDFPSIRPFTSDKFSTVDEIDDVRDYINFSNGSVAPGETVTFNYAINDFSPEREFYLRQRPNYRQSFEPASGMSLLGLSFLGASSNFRRRKLQQIKKAG